MTFLSFHFNNAALCLSDVNNRIKTKAIRIKRDGKFEDVIKDKMSVSRAYNCKSQFFHAICYNKTVWLSNMPMRPSFVTVPHKLTMLNCFVLREMQQCNFCITKCNRVF